jgi:diguanylate cyclase (GGDEF)-like protein
MTPAPTTGRGAGVRRLVWRIRTRFGLLARVGVLSAITVTVLGFVLADVMARDVRAEALASARRQVAAVAAATAGRLDAKELWHGITPQHAAEFDEEFHTGMRDDAQVRVKIWSPTGTIVYSDDHSLIGRTFPIDDQLELALRGSVRSEVSNLSEAENVNDRGHGRLLEVYVPLRTRHGKVPVGAFETYLSYAPIQRSVNAQTRHLYLLLLAGLLALWAVLFRLVAGASRALRRTAAENERLATLDGVTGLPNRLALTRHLAELVDRRRPCALLLVDLDRFKDVNDTLGHDYGDTVLRDIGARLSSTFTEPGALVARLGGDEFAVAVPLDAPGTTDAATRIEDALEEPVWLSGIQVSIEASIGMSRYPDDAEDADALLRQADTAMYEAKISGSAVTAYSAGTDPFDAAKLSLLGELRDAVGNGELRLHYQPTIDVADGVVRGVEALVRWQHPDLGLLAPDRFIPLAENTGLIRRITSWVLEEAIGQSAAWARRGLDLSLSVNLSARNLHDDGLVREVAAALERHGVAPEKLTLEVTETAVMADPQTARQMIRAFAALGVSVAIDDFGTGYTSLNQLAGLDVQTLKIDKSFVLAMRDDARNAAIVESIINLGKSLHLTTFAEGVETERHWSDIRALGCDAAQGYYFARPLTPEALEAWLRARGAHMSEAPVG